MDSFMVFDRTFIFNVSFGIKMLNYYVPLVDLKQFCWQISLDNITFWIDSYLVLFEDGQICAFI